MKNTQTLTSKCPMTTSQLKIMIVCFVSMAFTMGAITNCSGIFVKPMSESLGCSRSELSMIYSLYSAGQVITALLAGKIFSRFPTSAVMRCSAVLTGVGMAAMGAGSSMAGLYIAALLVGVGMGGLCMVPVSLLVKNWFGRACGLPLGIAMSGSGLGGMMFSLIFVNGLPVLGWRSCYFLTAGLQLFILLPLIMLWARDAPGEGAHFLHERDRSRKLVHRRKEMAVILKGSKFWLFALASTITYSSVSTIHQAAPAYLSDMGCGAEQISVIVSGGMLSLAIGKIVLGGIYDRTNAMLGTVASAVCGLVALGAMICVRTPFAPWLYILFFGVGYSFGSIAYPIVTEALFDSRCFASLNGIYNAMGSLSLSVGVMEASAIYDRSGSYLSAYKLFFLLSAAAIAVYIKLIPGRWSVRREGK